VVEEDYVSFSFNSGGGDFIGLAAAGEKARVRFGAAALDQANDCQARRFRQALEFLRAFCVIRGVKIERDEQRAFAARRTFKQSRLPLRTRARYPRCPAN
jgi:hypothetical protein